MGNASNPSLTPEEIRRIRDKYRLSQQSFARLLGIGEASMARYEGGSTPTRANANLIRAAEKPSFMRDCLERDGDLIPCAQRERASEIVYSLISLDAEGGVADMTDIYLITLEQEILNEKAANILADLHRRQREAEGNGDTNLAYVFECIISDLAVLKPQITTLENATREKVAELKGQVTALEHLASIMLAKAA